MLQAGMDSFPMTWSQKLKMQVKSMTRSVFKLSSGSYDLWMLTPTQKCLGGKMVSSYFQWRLAMTAWELSWFWLEMRSVTSSHVTSGWDCFQLLQNGSENLSRSFYIVALAHRRDKQTRRTMERDPEIQASLRE